jgi:hypothetical protein
MGASICPSGMDENLSTLKRREPEESRQLQL